MEFREILSTLVGTLEAWLTGAVKMLPNLALAALVLVVFFFLSRWGARLAERGVGRLTHNQPVSGLAKNLTRLSIIAAGVLLALSLLNLDKTVTSVLAGVGVVGLALGFAFKDIAANFMSGLLMALKRPFDVGDLVEVGGQFGTVEGIQLRSTQLRTLQGLNVQIPNQDVYQAPIINYTRTGDRRMDLAIGVAYDDDLELVRETVCRAVTQIRARDRDREPEAFFTEFGDSSINLTLRVWLTQADQTTYLGARSDAIIAVKKAFDDAGISIPFPIRTLDFGAQSVGGVRLDHMTLKVQDAA